jgi:hypothetical protein
MSFGLKSNFLNISTNLQTVLAARAHLAETKLLQETLNIVKQFHMFQTGAQMPSVAGGERQNIEQL